MANKAFQDIVNGKPQITREGILEQIARSMTAQGDLMARSSGRGGMDYDLKSAVYNENANRARLKELLSLVDQGGMSGSGSASGSGWSNPFGGSGGGMGGAGGASAAGAPQFSNADNRFNAGLTDAESRLRSLLDDPNSIRNTAAYNFRLNQGQEALQRSLGAKGMLNSGNRLMELQKYGQDMASQEYDNQFGRLKDILGNYSQGYTADKNANVNLYGAKATAFNQAQANQNNLTTNNQKIWSERTPVPIPGFNNGFKWV